MVRMYFQHATLEQETLPVSAVAFRRYVEKYQIEPLDVALHAGVRYLTVWRIGQGFAIKSQDERLIRQGLLRMTGVPYTAPMLVRDKREQADGRPGQKTTPPRKIQWK